MAENKSMLPDAEKVSQIIREVAVAEILPRFRKLEIGDVSEKHPGDLVTIADIEAERRLTDALKDLMPGSAVVGEEAAAADPDLVGALGGKGPVWIVDPLDGTQNFANGVACFAVIVAFCRDGRTLAGWIHDPLADATVWAAAGEGAWEGRARLGAAASGPTGEMTGSLGSALRRRMTARREAGEDGIPRKLTRVGCVGRDYADLARGRIDFARYGGRLKPWDHAAGVLLHAEAGGYGALTEDGGPYRLYPGIDGRTLLMAPDEETWHAVRALLGDA